MFKKKRLVKIKKNIKEIKIQGATNVAKAALKAYYLSPTQQTKTQLLKLRPTEPMMSHVLDLADKQPRNKIIKHFNQAQDKINKQVYKLIKNNQTIFTHCHSTNVIKALIYSKKHKKKFQVYNTETRPLYQGRKTSKELKRAGISVTQFTDSAISTALTNTQDTNKTDLILLGADALLKNSIINKIGSKTIAQLAKDYKIPLHIVADSWKYSSKSIKLEQRDFREIWNPKKNKIHIKNPAFEAIPKKHITKIITELGTMSYGQFLKKVR